MAAWNPGVAWFSPIGLALGVAVAAIIGAWIRYAVTFIRVPTLRQRPWATWGLNMVACFLMGLLSGRAPHRPSPSEGGMEVVLAVGFLGSLSTYSSLMAELLTTWQRRAKRQALALGAASLLGGLMACQLGLTLGRDDP